MRNSFFNLLIILLSITGCNLVNNAENNPIIKDVELLPFTNDPDPFIEIEPEFKNGDLNTFIEKNINYSLAKKYKIPNGNYDVSIGVMLTKEGFVDQVIKLSFWGDVYHKGILEDELIRIVKKSPEWTPYQFHGIKMPKLVIVNFKFIINQNPSLKNNVDLVEYKNEQTVVIEEPHFNNGDINTFIKDNVNKKIFNEQYIPKGVYKTSVAVLLTKEGDVQKIINLTSWGVDGNRGIFEKELSRIIVSSSKWTPYSYCGVKLPKLIRIDYDFIKE